MINEFKKKLITITENDRRLWSTTSKCGWYCLRSSTVIKLLKPRCLAISTIGPWPDIKHRFLWNDLSIFNGECDIITWSAFILIPNNADSFAALDERSSLPAFVTNTVGTRKSPFLSVKRFRHSFVFSSRVLPLKMTPSISKRMPKFAFFFFQNRTYFFSNWFK